MKWRELFLVVVCLCVELSVPLSTPEDAHYVAGVMEYHHDKDTHANLDSYVHFIREAGSQNVDILVFPEMTLTRGTAVTIPVHGLLKDYPIPADHPELYHEILVQLSRAARAAHLYLVVNVQEEMNCAQAPGEYCPTTNLYKFNTNVVFDRSGKVIDRYRKINLFGEYSRSPPLVDELGVFTTDFGVTFGHFICFDVVFQIPAIQVLQKYNISDVAYSTMWFSEMPYLTAVEVQQAYAYGNNINFLASGANNVKFGSAGSGIYSGRAGTLISTIPGINTRKLLVSKVPKIPGQVSDMVYPGPLPNDPSSKDNLRLNRAPSLSKELHKNVEQTVDEQVIQLEDVDASCSVRIKLRKPADANVSSGYLYRVFAFGRTVTYVQRTLGIDSCGLVACLTDDVTTCAVRNPTLKAKYEIEELDLTLISLRPKFNVTNSCNDQFYYPVTLQNSKFPLNPSEFSYTSENIEINGKDKLKLTMRLVQPQKTLLTFGIWGRNYNKDVNKRDQEVDEKTKLYDQQFEDAL